MTQRSDRIHQSQHRQGMGVIINRARTYAAVIDIAALLAAPRQQGTSHTLSSSVVLTPGIVRFVNIQPGK